MINELPGFGEMIKAVRETDRSQYLYLPFPEHLVKPLREQYPGYSEDQIRDVIWKWIEEARGKD